MTELPRVRVIGSWRRAFTIVVLCASVANISWNVAKMDDDDAFRSLQTKKDQLNQQIQLLNDKLMAQVNYSTWQPEYKLVWSLGHRTDDGRCTCTIDSVCGTKSNHIDLLEDRAPGSNILRSPIQYPLRMSLWDHSSPACPAGRLAIDARGWLVCQ